MKSLIVASLAILLASVATQAQDEYATPNKEGQPANQEAAFIKKEKREERKALRKLSGQEPSYQSKEQFAEDFDNVSNVSWKRTKYFDEATFTKDGQRMTAFYDNENTLVGTTQVKSFADLPADAQKTIGKKYKDYNIGKVILFDDNESNDASMLLYGQQFEDTDNYFVELQKDNRDIVLQVNMEGEVFFFTQLY